MAVSKLQERINACERVLSKDPESKFFASLAEALRQDGQLRRAAEVCLKGLEHWPEYSTAFLVLARIRGDSGEFELAWEAMSRAEHLDPNNMALGVAKVQLAIRQGDRPAAEKQMAALTQHWPDCFEIASLQTDIAKMVAGQLPLIKAVPPRPMAAPAPQVTTPLPRPMPGPPAEEMIELNLMPDAEPFLFPEATLDLAPEPLPVPQSVPEPVLPELSLNSPLDNISLIDEPSVAPLEPPPPVELPLEFEEMRLDPVPAQPVEPPAPVVPERMPEFSPMLSEPPIPAAPEVMPELAPIVSAPPPPAFPDLLPELEPTPSEPPPSFTPPPLAPPDTWDTPVPAVMPDLAVDPLIAAPEALAPNLGIVAEPPPLPEIAPRIVPEEAPAMPARVLDLDLPSIVLPPPSRDVRTRPAPTQRSAPTAIPARDMITKLGRVAEMVAREEFVMYASAVHPDGRSFSFPTDVPPNHQFMLELSQTLCKILKLSWGRFGLQDLRECYTQFQRQIVYILWLPEGNLIMICADRTPEGSIRVAINKAMRKI